ncbi:MAG: hypothetical protein GY723_22005 [bacterium]|nr:hypothetical protein [bacterium]
MTWKLQRNPVEEVAKLTDSMTETELKETLGLLAERVAERLPQPQWIDLAARMATDQVGKRPDHRAFPHHAGSSAERGMR